MLKSTFSIGILFLSILPFCLAGQEIAVLYPEVKQPFQAVFLDIVNGIKEHYSSDVKEKIMPEDFNAEDMGKWFASNENTIPIILGSKGLRLSSSINFQKPALISAIVSIPEELVQFARQQVIVNIIPHPKLLFQELNKIAPRVKNVFVLYSETYSKELIQKAITIAQNFNINLSTYKTKSLQESAQKYKGIFQTIQSKTDAIWILQDQLSINNDVILPELLKTAWNKNIILFSSRFSDVKKGVLFSLYSDNYSLGKRLAMIAGKINQGLYTKGDFQFLQDVHTAINLRTAQHMEINVTPTEQDRFNLIFPNR